MHFCIYRNCEAGIFYIQWLYQLSSAYLIWQKLFYFCVAQPFAAKLYNTSETIQQELSNLSQLRVEWFWI